MTLSDKIDQFKNFDFNNLDFENIDSWPILLKVIATILLMLLVFSFGYQFFISNDIVSYKRIQKKEIKLREEFTKKSFHLGNIDAYKSQLTEIKKTFGVLLKQLPTKTEVSRLLEDITYIGVQSGLVFDAIDLQPEILEDFYTELPIKISGKGNYHEIASFVSGVVGLPRIVTLHDFSIRKIEGKSLLYFELVARTYRYKE